MDKVDSEKIDNIVRKSKKGKKKIKFAIILIFLLFLLGSLLYIFRGLFIVASVNGKPITRFELIKNLERESGQIVLDNLITKALIEQETKKRGISISEAVINAEVENIEKIVEAQGTTLEDLLKQKGLTLEDLKSQVEIQKGIEEMLKGEINISDDQIQSFYQENQDIYKDANYEDIKDEIRKQLEQEELSKKFSELVKKLRDEASIKYFVQFTPLY